MAGQAASRAVPFGSAHEPQRLTGSVIQIKARTVHRPDDPAPGDPALPLGQPASLSAQEDNQP